MVKFRLNDGELVRVLWTDGVCRTPEALAKLVNAPSASWESYAKSGDTTPKPMLKLVSKKPSANNPEFLGLQNPPKAVKPVELDGEDKPVPCKRGKKALAVDVDKMRELAPTMTLKQASEAMGVPYPTLVNRAKQNGIVFVKGKRGGYRRKEQENEAPLAVNA
jgi:hypothetical protein